MTTQPFIAINSVTRSFSLNGREVHALRGVDLQVAAGSFVVLMGPSGSGKTTLLNLIGGLDQPSSGSVTVGGQRLDQLGGAALAAQRRTIGFIFQSFALIPTASAYENVELGLRVAGHVPRKEWDTRIRRCVAAVGLSAWIDHRPYELSGGQQQRVAIARALAVRPKLMLADEPTGDLDSSTGEQVLSLLRDLVDQQGLTLVLATHDPMAAEFATHRYNLRDGKILQE
ncbi:MAG: ABC transporter ATP-binding protein [Chloroflexaceae bacterium]|jgi:ABC-type lipoprotein export system ATPase subunit|nr:ABC transporter ATP-binding protein [Chloroflexaceae bacterium]